MFFDNPKEGKKMPINTEKISSILSKMLKRCYHRMCGEMDVVVNSAVAMAIELQNQKLVDDLIKEYVIYCDCEHYVHLSPKARGKLFQELLKEKSGYDIPKIVKLAELEHHRFSDEEILGLAKVCYERDDEELVLGLIPGTKKYLVIQAIRIAPVNNHFGCDDGD
jgi:hypothetical protein